MRDFADRLRQRAATLRLSNAELARRLGLSDQRLGNYLAGTREPDLEMLARLASALQTTPNELLGFADADRGERIEQLRARAHQAIDEMDWARLELIVRMIEAV